jgi:DNA-binding beta-propeller fold protein YncE
MRPRDFILVFGAVLGAAGPRAAGGACVLAPVADVPLSGGATRFDYQSFDPRTNRLYLSHMGDGELVVFDTQVRRVVTSLGGFPTVTGVLVIPELHRVFASAAGSHEVVVVDTETWKTLAHLPAGQFPDGLAFAPDAHQVYVSDESEGLETVIDVRSNRRVTTIDVGGEAGNTQFDSVSQQILVNVQTRNQLVVIDPKTDTVVGRRALAGGKSPHGLCIAASARLAFVACEGDSKLLVLDLNTWSVTNVFATGQGPDVLAFDAVLGRLYVATESGLVSVFRLGGRTLSFLGEVRAGPDAHSVCVNPSTHEVFLPLKNVGGHPVLRIMRPPGS